jgi:hypothetical protein
VLQFSGGRVLVNNDSTLGTIAAPVIPRAAQEP